MNTGIGTIIWAARAVVNLPAGAQRVDPAAVGYLKIIPLFPAARQALIKPAETEEVPESNRFRDFFFQTLCSPLQDQTGSGEQSGEGSGL